MKRTLDEAVARLDDYLRSGESDPGYEEDLFARALAEEAPELAFRAGIEEALREMSARGTIALWRSARQVEELVASGRRVRRFDYDPANPTLPDLSGDFDVLVTRIALDLAGVRRLDAEVFTPDGQLLKKMPEIDFDPSDGAVYACCEADLARAASSARALTRVWATDDAGSSRVLAELPSG